MGTRLRVVGVGVFAVATLFLPWFRQTQRKKPSITFNAWQAGAPWALAITALIVVFVGLALWAHAKDVRFLPYAGGVGILVTLVIFARCWVNLDPTVVGANMERRWGLFIALNLVPLFGWALASVGRSVMQFMMPPITERDHGYAI
jgi:hypothetical protein